MLKKPKALIDAYESYEGDNDAHRLRLTAIALTSVILSLVSSNLSDAALPAMALAVSVLAGFTFTALFSSGALSVHDLPEPRDESDRHDRERLRIILNNFRARSKLFLYTSVIALILILLVSVEFDWSALSAALSWAGFVFTSEAMYWLQNVHFWISKAMIAISFFVFLEMLYLFYRLSESVFSFLEIRRKYLGN